MLAMSESDGQRDKTGFTTSLSLIDLARRQDPDAWSKLCDIYTPLVYGWARKAGLQEADAGDVTQEVFQSVAKNVTRFRRDREGDTFRGWLWTITRNQIRGWYRKRADGETAEGGSDARMRIESVPDWISNDTTLEEVDVSNSAEAIIIRKAAVLIEQDFATHTWQAFWRLAIESQPTAQIASDLNMTSGAVRQAKHRVLVRFREVLGEDLLGNQPQ